MLDLEYFRIKLVDGLVRFLVAKLRVIKLRNLSILCVSALMSS